MIINYNNNDFSAISIQAGVQLCLWTYLNHPLGNHILTKKKKERNILFLHGYLDTAKSFWPIMSLFSKDSHINTMSLSFRGHGESESVGKGGSYHQLDHLKDLSLAVEEIKDRFGEIDLIVAHSMGGIIALLYNAAFPNEVKNILLLDSLGAPSEEAKEQIFRLKKVLSENRRYSKSELSFKKVETLQEAQKRILRNNPHLSNLGASYMVKYSLKEDSKGQLSFSFDPKLRGTTPIRYPEEMWIEVFKNIQSKVHFIRADKGYIPLESIYLKRFSYLEKATSETYTDIGHHLHVDAPHQVIASIKTYFPNLFL